MKYEDAKSRLFLLFLFNMLICSTIFAQTNYYGIPIVDNYKPSNYQAAPQNHAIIQDHEGIMYFGNLGYVLEYDGVTWNKILIEPFTEILSLDIDSLGTIYVSAGNEFGYLQPNPAGELEYVSLSSMTGIDDKQVDNVGKTFVSKDGVYFQTSETLYKYPYTVRNPVKQIEASRNPKTWKSENYFTNSFYIPVGSEEFIFLLEPGKGILQLKNEKTEQVKYSQKFARGKKIITMLPPPARKQIFVGTEKHGLWYYPPGYKPGKLHSRTNKYLNEIVLLQATALPEYYILATLNKGVMVIKRKRDQKKYEVREVIEQFTKQSGLPSEQINAIYNNQQHDKRLLWLASRYGISKTKISSPLRRLYEASEVKDVILDITRFNDILYVRTLGNVYYMADTLQSNRFLSVNNIVSNNDWIIFPVTWNVEEEVEVVSKEKVKVKVAKKKRFWQKKAKTKTQAKIVTKKSLKTIEKKQTEEKILIGSRYGLYKIDSVRHSESIKMDFVVNEDYSINTVDLSEENEEADPYYIQRLYKSGKSKDRIFLGLSNGIAIVSNQNGFWIDEGRIKGIHESISSIAEDSIGNIWLGVKNKGLFFIDVPDTTFIRKVQFGEDENDSLAFNLFSKNVNITLFDKDELPELQENGILHFDNTMLFSTRKGLYHYLYEERKFVPDNTFNVEKGFIIHNIIEDDKKNCWLRTQSAYNIGVELYRKTGENTYERDEQSLKLFPDMTVEALYPDKDGVVWISGTEGLYSYDTDIDKDSLESFNTLIRKIIVGNDSVLFAGTNYLDNKITHKQSKKVVLPFGYNKISFDFAAPFFEDESSIVYSYRLKGFENKWSEWSEETSKEYMNLDHGRYTFRVKARNIYGVESNEATFKFRIKPPWWEAGWFYLAENGTLILMVVLSYFWNKFRKGAKLTEIMTFMTIITIFETLLIYLQGFADQFTGGVPIFVILMHIFLALLLVPVQNFVDKALHAEIVLAKNEKQ